MKRDIISGARASRNRRMASCTMSVSLENQPWATSSRRRSCSCSGNSTLRVAIWMTISVPGPNGKNDPLAEIRWQTRRDFGQSEKRSSSEEDSHRPRARCSEDTNSSCSGGCSSIPDSRGARPFRGTAESFVRARSPCRPSSGRFARPGSRRRPSTRGNG